MDLGRAGWSWRYAGNPLIGQLMLIAKGVLEPVYKIQEIAIKYL